METTLSRKEQYQAIAVEVGELSVQLELAKAQLDTLNRQYVEKANQMLKLKEELANEEAE